MALRDLGPADDAAARRDRFLRLAEGRMADAAGAAIRAFLRDVLAAVSPESLTAATGDVPTSLRLFTLGEAVGWWDDAVATHVVDEVRRVWRAGYFDTRDGDLLASNQRAIDDYLGHVTDRLSRTATPTIPEQAFDVARVALADEVARSSPIDDMALRLAQEFSWDADATLSRERLAATDARIDEILDAIGPPGDDRREAARLGGDAEVARLQAERREHIAQIDRTQSGWQTRAERIARTETCGAYNAGAIDAGFAEGQAVKVWMATGDDRTRDDHLAAAGQCVPMADRFTVGGEALVMPGDPQGPAGQIINCRCTVVFADSCEQASSRYSRSRDAIDRQRAERGLEPLGDPDEPATVDADDLTDRFGRLGENVTVRDEDDPVVQQHLADLEAIPEPWRDALADHGTGVDIGAGPIPTFAGHEDLANVRPRGWPEGSTWSNVPGMYDEATNRVIAGAGGHGHGSVSLMHHEVGHALDRALAGRIPVDPYRGPVSEVSMGGFGNTYGTVLREGGDRISPYHRQPGPAGRSELFAEGVAAFLADGATATPGAAMTRLCGGSAAGAARMAEFYTDLL